MSARTTHTSIKFQETRTASKVSIQCWNISPTSLSFFKFLVTSMNWSCWIICTSKPHYTEVIKPGKRAYKNNQKLDTWVLQQFIFSNNSAKTILFNRKGEKVMYISYNCQRILHR
jgi:hypothetical protein